MPCCPKAGFSATGRSVMPVRLRAVLVGLALSAAMMPDAYGDALLLSDGSQLDAQVLSVTGTTIAVRLASGGLRNLRRQDLAEIELELADRTTVRGVLVSFSGKLYRLRRGDELLSIRDGALIDREQVDAAAADGQGAGGPAGRIDPDVARRSYAPPPIFILHDGDTVVGRVQAREGDELKLRLATGGEHSLSMAEISGIALRETASGPLLEGRFLGWVDGTYLMQVDGQWLRIHHGQRRQDETKQPNGPIM